MQFSTRQPNKAFTLIEVSVAIALVVVGLAIAALSFGGYGSWASDAAARTNAQNLVNASLQARLHAIDITDGGLTFPLAVTAARANQIYSSIDGDLIVEGGGTVRVIPAGMQLPVGAEFPAGWMETSSGLFAPIP